MPLQLDAAISAVGTRFRLFPLPPYAGNSAFANPETVTVSVPLGSVREGPEDDRMYVVDATDKTPYSEFSQPPYLGPAGPKVKPGPGGHFDHLAANTREFTVCSMYATVRRVLDIWEGYLGRRIEWHFALAHSRLELIPLIVWDNAQSGYGFLEFGYGRRAGGGIDFSRPYCLNFDILAHELGHSLIFSVVGEPGVSSVRTADFGGFHESAGDLTALVALLHFDSVVDHLLQNSHGNLFTVNELERIGELSASGEIRRAFNYLRMSDVTAEPHDRSQPLTGAFFDIFVEIYQRHLVARKLITQNLASASLGPRGQSAEAGGLQRQFDAAYAFNPAGFKAALLEARDEFGTLLAMVWSRISPDNFSYARLALATLAQDQALNGGVNREGIRSSFAWREIAVPGGSLLLTIRRVAERIESEADAPVPPAPSIRGAPPRIAALTRYTKLLPALAEDGAAPKTS